MRSITHRTAVVVAALLTACATDSIEGPGSPAAGPSLTKGASLDATFTYTTVDVPGAIATSAWGINAGGDIVGSYTDASRRTHGYLLEADAYTTIDYPGAAKTEARGIGPAGDIVGLYVMPGEPSVNTHGFLLTKHGEFVAVNDPPHTSTIAQRILPDGTMLGCRHDQDQMATMHGIAVTRSGIEELAQPTTMNNGGTPNGRRLTGFFTDMMDGNKTKGYVVDDGVFTPFMVPASTVTVPWDMNPAGEIAGTYRDATFRAHGFVRLGDQYATLDFPGAAATRGFGLNAGGVVVGNYANSALQSAPTHGFVATPAND